MLIRERLFVDTLHASNHGEVMTMRGTDGMQEGLFTVAKLEDFVPADHPLRAIRLLVNRALVQLNGLFNDIYADSGRASIAPEKLLRAMLIQVFFSVRSERELMEQVRYNLLCSLTPSSKRRRAPPAATKCWSTVGRPTPSCRRTRTRLPSMPS
jgi:hypothetical protein